MPTSIPLLARLQPETPDFMLQAAQVRLNDAYLLLSERHWDGAIYNGGYVAEMTMKVVYCRLDPTFPTNGLVDSTFRSARDLWRSIFPGASLPYNYLHDLLFWEAVIDAQRGAVLSSTMERLTVSRSLFTVRQHWKVGLRYQPALATEDEANAVCDAVRIIYENREALWRK